MNRKPETRQIGRKLWSFAAGALVVVLMFGGPWSLLQVAAWTRMVVVYSQQGSLVSALVKTFDGRHPCALCLRVRVGQQEDQHHGRQNPSEKEKQMTELICDAPCPAVLLAPPGILDVPHPPAEAYAHLLDSPPTPPPRAGLEVL